MAKLINLINLDEIKTLRITCEKCHAYWSVPVPLGKNKLPRKCIYCDNEISEYYLNNIEMLLEGLEKLLNNSKDFKISIELEIEGKKSISDNL